MMEGRYSSQQAVVHMIFGKSNKPEPKEEKEAKSVEDAALDRWRSFSQSEAVDTDESSQTEEQEPYSSESIQLTESIVEGTPIEEVPESAEFTPDNFVDSAPIILEDNTSEGRVLNLNQVVETEEIDEPVAPPVPRTPTADLSLPVQDDLNNRFGSNLKSALGDGTVVDGLFSFETPVKIGGTLTGEIKSSSTLIVGENAHVEAKIQVGSLIVLGSVEGDVEAQDLIEIRSSGALRGNVSSKRIALEKGGIFNGNCRALGQ